LLLTSRFEKVLNFIFNRKKKIACASLEVLEAERSFEQECEEEEDTLYLIIQLKKLLSCSEGDDDEEI